MRRFLTTLVLLACAFPCRADLIKQSSTYTRTVLITQSADHITGLTGATLTITASKAGGAYAAITPTVTERGNGVYALSLTTGNTDTLGALDLHVTATSADPSDTHDQVVAFDPNDAVRLGLTALPNAAAGTTGGLQTPVVANGTAQAGSGTTLTLAVGSSATTDLYKGNAIRILSGTGAGQARVITGYNGGTLVATVSRAWIVSPDATSVYTIVAEPHVAIDSNLAVALQTGQNVATLSGQQAPANLSNLMISGGGVVQANTTQFAGQTITASAGVTIPSVISSYAGGDTSGTTTLLGRIPGTLTLSGIAANILATPANLLVTNGSGYVTSTNAGTGLTTQQQNQLTAAAGAQQAGSPVTLPVTPPTGYGAGVGIYYSPVVDTGGGTGSTTNLAITLTRNGSGQPVLTWTADTASVSYKVLRSTNGSAYTVIATLSASTLTYTDMSRPAGTVYYTIISVH